MFSVKMDSVTTKNLKHLSDELAIISNVRESIRLGFQTLGKQLQTKARNAIYNPPKTGRIYIYKGNYHQASAPGEAPANRSGRLARGVLFVARPTELKFGYTTPYGLFLERGTRKMKPRPNIEKTARAAEKDAQNFIRSAMRTNIRRIFL